MRPKLEGTELLRDMGKVMGLFVVILWICGVLFAFVFKIVLPPGEKPVPPEFTFRNVGPCLGLDRNRVEKFEVGDKQYICADMETDKSQAQLYLYIFKSENKDQVYVDGATFTSGPIKYHIYPPLPPGNYWAYISWARPALVEFEFEVVEK